MNKFVNPIVIQIGYSVLILGILTFIYADNLFWLWRKWMENPHYSHGPLIPLIALSIAYQKRDEIRKIYKQGSIIGIWVLILAALFYVISMRAQVRSATSYSLIMMLVGVVLFLYGKKTFAVLAFPICFLFFMVPFWSGAITKLSNALKILSSVTTHHIISLLGYPIFRDGVIIHLSKGTLEVADPCSGIRSLMALLALGTVIAYYAETEFYVKVLIILLAIPIAFIGNTLRVVFFAIVLEEKGVIITEGPLHMLSGLAVFVFAFILLILASKWMSRS